VSKSEKRENFRFAISESEKVIHSKQVHDCNVKMNGKRLKRRKGHLKELLIERNVPVHLYCANMVKRLSQVLSFNVISVSVEKSLRIANHFCLFSNLGNCEFILFTNYTKESRSEI
jgi:hypothetical protein